MAKVVIFGAGDIARLAHHYLTTDSRHKVVAFVVDKKYRKGRTFAGLPLIDSDHLVRQYPPGKYSMFIAISYVQMNMVRAEKYLHAKKLGYDFVSYVSSRCSFLTDDPIGENCFILEDNTIQPFVKIKNNVTLWSGNHIGHHSIVEDHCFISSHVVVSGHVRIQKYCFLGVNSTIRNSITLAPSTFVGAGAIILRDTENNSVYLSPRSKKISHKSYEMKF